MVKCTRFLVLRMKEKSNPQNMTQPIKKCISDTAGSVVDARRGSLSTATGKRPRQHLTPWEEFRKGEHMKQLTPKEGSQHVRAHSLLSAGVK